MPALPEKGGANVGDGGEADKKGEFDIFKGGENARKDYEMRCYKREDKGREDLECRLRMIAATPSTAVKMQYSRPTKRDNDYRKRFDLVKRKERVGSAKWP